MFCPRCGTEIEDGATECFYCGRSVVEMSNREFQIRKTMIAIFLLIVFGFFGVHRFYFGDKKGGIIMLLCFFFNWLIIPMGVLLIWLIVDFLRLAKSLYIQAINKDVQ